jgi:PTS system fructose-specific IIC component
MSMKLLNFTGPELVFARLSLGKRDDVIRLLVDRLVEEGKISQPHAGQLVGEILAREEVETTGIGGGIAIPHARSEHVLGSVVQVATMREPIPWNAIDGEPIDVVFLLAGNRELPGQQLRVLARISKLVRIASFLDDLRRANTPAEIVRAIQVAEARHF